MSENALKTLFLPFENGATTRPADDQGGIFYGARTCPELSQWPGLKMVQDFYPEAALLPPETLQQEGDEAADYVLALLPRQVAEAKGVMARALNLLKNGGVFAFAADNDAGGGRLAGWMKETGLPFSSLSKHHARVVFGRCDLASLRNDVLKQWIDEATPRDINLDGGIFRTRPGLFSWDRIDTGSRLLAAHLPPDLKGVGADFGCGYGWLARQTIRKNPDIQTLYLIDADRRAVDIAAHNLAGKPVQGLWTDLTRGAPGLPPLDFIVMNPPFHEGKTTDTDIGSAFIETAGKALKPGGTLWMVANRHLPYEVILKTHFSIVMSVLQKDGFKITHAIK